MNKKSIIKEIFSGNRGAYENIKLSDSYKEAENKMFPVLDSFLEKLTKEQKELSTMPMTT